MTPPESSPEFSQDLLDQAAAFDRIGANYEAVFGANATQEAALAWLRDRLPEGASVLDLGAGTGAPTAAMLSAAGHRVVGIDISPEMVRIAREQVPAATFHVMSMSELQLGEARFDAVTAFFSLLMLRRADIERVLSEMAERVRPGGYALVSMVEGDFDYLEVPFLDQSLHVSAYPREAFRELLGANGFEILEHQAVVFQASEATPPETQLFYTCQRSE
ncbi:class I SAM-dependent methyltransferase [Haliangium ochraceum]|uniref:Methyltransferase type 11 n=1 Tax=Haliangium ochraceum (strain DSM 14365 / JCM 11303 / SMP-2) TaxID=502025 RepID=D0LTZ0_HALO1|nr:class I SAM-dependent methyltransferase [Haliangium ochraceum]ACY17354.1 Methyltransferase type 11 [Haliangium ochraceum DSM 14365]